MIEEFDKTTEQIMANGDVPVKLGSFANTDTPDEEPNAVRDTHTEVAESQSEVLAESRGPSAAVPILIGLAVIGVVGLLVFRKLKA